MGTSAPVQAPTKALWSDLGGMIVCSEHLGMSATAELEVRPNARQIRTPITVWDRLGPLDFQVAREEYDWTPACESCGFIPAVAR